MLATFVKAGLHRAQGQAQARPDLVQGQVSPVVQDDDLAAFSAHPLHRAEDRVALDERPEWIAAGGLLRGSLEVDEADPAAPAHPVATDVDQDPVEPGLEAGRVAQRLECRPGP